MLSFDSANSPALDILENMDVGVLVYDADGKLLFVNALATRLLGASVEDLQALQGKQSAWSLVEADGAVLLPQDLPLNQVLRTGEAVTGRTFGVAGFPPGSQPWFSMSAKPVRDAYGIIRRIVVTLVDITEQKRAEDRSERTRKQLESALGSMTDAVFIVGADGQVLHFNEGFVRFYRFESRAHLPSRYEDFVGFMQLLHPDGTPVPLADWALPRAMRGEIGINLEFVVRRRDTGEEWPASYSFGPIRNDNVDIDGAVLVARDISGSKQREAALRAAEVESGTVRRTLESALASMTDALYIIDTHDKVLEINDAFVSFFRFKSRAECPRSTSAYGEIIDMFDANGAQLPPHRRVATSALRGEVATNRELSLRRRDTGEEWVASYGYSPIRNAEGGIIGAVVVARDVTENKRRERALIAAEAESRAVRQRLESALANMTDALVVTDAEGNFLEFNDAFVRYLKAPNRETCMHRIHDYPANLEVFFPNGEVAPIKDWSLTRALRGETATNAEYILRRRDTGETWVGSYNYAPIRNAQGQIEGAVVVARDVTAQKEAVQSLKDSETRFRDLVNLAPEGVLVHREGIVMFVNPAMVALLGAQQASQVVGNAVVDYLAEEYRAVALERIDHQNATGNAVPPMEMECLRLDGSRVAVDVTGVPLEFDGERANLVFVRNIAARRQAMQDKARLEHEMRQMQKLESIGRLAGGIAHDFNNILMVQKGYCELLHMQMDQDDRSRNGLLQIEACADRAAGLTRQLLAFSRKQVIDPVVFDLNKVVDTLATMLRRLIGEDILLEVTPCAAPALVRADPGQMEQVLVNLAVNARDAMPDGGTLKLDIALFEVTPDFARTHFELSTGPYVRISVSDTGHGMDEDTRNQIFEPFFTTKPVGTGTGLGLSTVHGIVHQSGGTIAVYSEPGAGTTFNVYLPQVFGTTSLKPQAQASAGGQGEGELVLVVEDDASLRQLIQLMLEGLGYRVQLAESGEEAISLFNAAANRPDVVLTDVVMPGMNGRVLVERLREQVPDLAVVFMSGYTHDIIVHHGVPEDGLDFIQKPFTMDAISEKLKKVLGSRH